MCHVSFYGYAIFFVIIKILEKHCLVDCQSITEIKIYSINCLSPRATIWAPQATFENTIGKSKLWATNSRCHVRRLLVRCHHLVVAGSRGRAPGFWSEGHKFESSSTPLHFSGLEWRLTPVKERCREPVGLYLSRCNQIRTTMLQQKHSLYRTGIGLTGAVLGHYLPHDSRI